LNSLIFLGDVLKTSYFFLKIMHKVKTQTFGELLVKNMLTVCFYMVIVKTYKVKKILQQISGKSGVNLRKFCMGNFRKLCLGNFRTHNHTCTISATLFLTMTLAFLKQLLRFLYQ